MTEQKPTQREPLRCRLFGHSWLTWVGNRYERIDWFVFSGRGWPQKCARYRCSATRTFHGSGAEAQW